jgi:hypothetical protein
MTRFYTNDGQHLYLELDTGAEVEFYFEAGECSCIYLGGHELSATDDSVAKDVVFMVDGDAHVLSSLIEEADEQWDEVCNEWAKEALEESAYNAELASPYWTGRV